MKVEAPILMYPDQRLWNVPVPVEDSSFELSKLMERMQEDVESGTFHSISAVQYGVPWKVMYIRGLGHLVNPDLINMHSYFNQKCVRNSRVLHYVCVSTGDIDYRIYVPYTQFIVEHGMPGARVRIEITNHEKRGWFLHELNHFRGVMPGDVAYKSKRGYATKQFQAMLSQIGYMFDPSWRTDAQEMIDVALQDTDWEPAKKYANG